MPGDFAPPVGGPDTAPRPGFDAQAAAQALWSRCTASWESEASVVRQYLQDHRSRERDTRWLRLAAYKETRLYRELSASDRACYDAGQPVPGMRDEQRRILDEEMSHYRAIAALVGMLGATPPGPGDVLDFPADRALQRFRASLRASRDPLSRCASTLVEGGGGAMYRELSRLQGTPFDSSLAEVFTRILEDELTHGPGHLPVLAALLHGDDDAARVGVILDELCELRVRMREQMFSGD